MKIRQSLILLLACLLAIFGLALKLLNVAQQREVASVLAGMQEERTELLERQMTLIGQSLRSFASDYSQWDEMVKFVETGDPAWAAINLEPSMKNFDTQAIWVLRRDGSLVYQHTEGGDALLAALPREDAAFRALLESERNLHFFVDTPLGLAEFRTAPIQPSADLRHTTPPVGWYVTARLWDELHFRALGETLRSTLTLDGPPGSGDASLVSYSRDLPDWRGHRLHRLQAIYQSPALARLIEGNVNELYLLLAFGGVVILTTAASLSRWVSTPLQRLGRSLETRDERPLLPLLEQRNEFGHLASLVRDSFTQRAQLEGEIAARRQTEDALRATEGDLRRALELRSRLARDLHDGMIQSIYAAGLALEGVRSVITSDPERAGQRVVAVQKSLNDTIWEVRNFITGLEAEVTHRPPFAQTLRDFASAMQSVHQSEITVEVDPAAAAGLSAEAERQLLQIARESLSNAVRHAQASRITLALQRTPTGVTFFVQDNGCGFEPAAVKGNGRGLANLRSRAAELGGELHVSTSPGNGTRLALSFQPASTTHHAQLQAH